MPAQPSPLVRLAPGFCEPKPGGFGERTVQRLAMELVVEEQLGRQARQEVEHVRVEIRRDEPVTVQHLEELQGDDAPRPVPEEE